MHEARRWTDLADLFHPQAHYWEPFFGHIEGREEIRDFLGSSMSGLEDWVFPIQWVVIDDNRAVTQWFNRLPKRRRDGTHFEFKGISNIAYDDDGLIVSQEDMYDRVGALRVLTEAKSPLLERLGGTVTRVGSPVVDFAKRLSGF